MAQWWGVVASLFFYGCWNWRFIPLLAFSVTLNFHLGRCIAKTRSKPLLVAGLAFNLGLLAYFKYANFLIQSYGGLAGAGAPDLDIVLLRQYLYIPLGGNRHGFRFAPGR